MDGSWRRCRIEGYTNSVAIAQIYSPETYTYKLKAIGNLAWTDITNLIFCFPRLLQMDNSGCLVESGCALTTAYI